MQLYIALYREGLSVGPLHRKGVSTPSPIPLLCASFALRARDGSHPDVCMSPRLSLAFWLWFYNDDLCHSLQCEALWTCVYSCFNCNKSSLAQTIPERACAHDVNLASISRLYVAYPSYHARRKLHSDLLQDAISSGDFEHVYDELLQLTRASKADISCAFEFECTMRYSLAGKIHVYIIYVQYYIYIYIEVHLNY